MTKDLPLSACCSAPIKSVGMGDFHDKDEVCTMHMECEKCGKPCDIKTEEDPPIVDWFGSVWGQRCPACKKLSMSVVRPGKVQCDSEKCNTPESDEGNSRESCSPPSSAGQTTSGEEVGVSPHGGILPNRKAARSSPDVQNPEADEGKSLAASVLPPSSADLRDLLHDFAMTYRAESRKSRNECIDNVTMKIGNLISIPSIKMKERLIAILYFALPALALIGFSVWLIKVSLLLP